MQPVAKTSSRPAAPRRSRPRGQASCAASASRQQPVAPTRDENRPASISKLKVAGLAALAAVVVGAGGAPDAFANGQSAPNGEGTRRPSRWPSERTANSAEHWGGKRQR